VRLVALPRWLAAARAWLPAVRRWQPLPRRSGPLAGLLRIWPGKYAGLSAVREVRRSLLVRSRRHADTNMA